MIRETDLVSYLPEYLQQYREQKQVLTVEDPEFSITWDAVNRVLNNEFISTADDYGISRYEKILGILPFAEDTIESRRSRVQARWFTAIPYTMKILLAKMENLCGEQNFTIRKCFSTYHIYIETGLELFGQVEELEKLVEEMFPCNLVPVICNKIFCEIYGKNLLASGVVSTDIIAISNHGVEDCYIHGDDWIGSAVTFTEMVTINSR